MHRLRCLGIYFYYTAFAVSESLVPVNLFNNTSCMVVDYPTARPKSFRNQCVIEGFGGVSVLSIVFLLFSWCKGFSYRTESDLSLIFVRLGQYDLASFPSMC